MTCRGDITILFTILFIRRVREVYAFSVKSCHCFSAKLRIQVCCEFLQMFYDVRASGRALNEYI